MSRLSIALALGAFLALPGAARAGDKIALVVGVDRYRDDELPSLKFAAADAIRLGAALERLGFDVITMTPQADKVSLRPDTPADIREGLDRRLKSCGRDDILVIALSGHGVQLLGDAPLPDGGRETWFCPAKARLRERSTLLPISDVIGSMAACPSGRKLLLVDACRNDMTPPGIGKPPSVLEFELDPAAPARRQTPDGMVALFSCSPRERSFELADLGHSVFTYHVIQYLEGRADDPARWYDGGDATLTDLVNYATKRTARSVEKDLAAFQNPELIGRMTDWSFGRVGADLAGAHPRPAAPNTPAAAQPGRIVENSLGMKLVVIPAGEFQMGSNESAGEKPIQAVRIARPFLLGQTEVTQAQFERVMAMTPWRGEKFVVEGADVAATYVSWDDAAKFCRQLTEIERQAGRLPATSVYRLPTEAEWEYACRAGTATKFSFGDDGAQLGEHAWWGGFGDGGTATAEQYAHSVSLKRPNPWNLFDMHGNVLEWCADPFAASLSPAGSAGAPQSSSRVVRGGSWGAAAMDCRSSSRDGDLPTARGGVIGFRVARDAE